MVGLCKCKKHKLVSPLRSTHTFVWMCEVCKRKVIAKKREEEQNYHREVMLIRKVMTTFSAVDDIAARGRRKRKG